MKGNPRVRLPSDFTSRLAARPATRTELRQLAGWIHQSFPDVPERTLELLQDAAIAVFDNYITDCPGYAGKVMSVVWSGSPTFFDVFTWSDGKLRQEDREY